MRRPSARDLDDVLLRAARGIADVVDAAGGQAWLVGVQTLLVLAVIGLLEFAARRSGPGERPGEDAPTGVSEDDG